ncbi:uncharacterized protein LOC115299266 [Suricata suricatta]|uniref:uncharacterized protein LOC115299266 n=1 Tax=Suricata suricatta TaxID=37032 RepID=UPI001155D8F0|nr:uncharacterized protein LOC115299266 [Suricata suricatta]
MGCVSECDGVRALRVVDLGPSSPSVVFLVVYNYAPLLSRHGLPRTTPWPNCWSLSERGGKQRPSSTAWLPPLSGGVEILFRGACLSKYAPEAGTEARVTGHTTVCGDSKVGSQHLGVCIFCHRMVCYWCISLLQESQEHPAGIPLVHFWWPQCRGSPILCIRIYCFRHNRKLVSSEAFADPLLLHLMYTRSWGLLLFLGEPRELAEPGQKCGLNDDSPSAVCLVVILLSPKEVSEDRQPPQGGEYMSR